MVLGREANLTASPVPSPQSSPQRGEEAEKLARTAPSPSGERAGVRGQARRKPRPLTSILSRRGEEAEKLARTAPSPLRGEGWGEGPSSPQAPPLASIRSPEERGSREDRARPLKKVLERGESQ